MSRKSRKATERKAWIDPQHQRAEAGIFTTALRRARALTGRWPGLDELWRTCLGTRSPTQGLGWLPLGAKLGPTPSLGTPPRPLRDSRQNIRWSTASFRDCAPALGTPTRRSCLVLALLEPDRDDVEDNAEVGAHRPGSRAASAPPRSATRSSPRPHWRRCSRSDREKHAPADDGRCRCSLELRRISAGILAAR